MYEAISLKEIKSVSHVHEHGRFVFRVIGEENRANEVASNSVVRSLVRKYQVSWVSRSDSARQGGWQFSKCSRKQSLFPKDDRVSEEESGVK